MSLGRGTTWKSISWRVLTLSALFFVTLLPGTGFGQGKGNGVEVLAVSPKLINTEPGKILSLSFRVTNKTKRDEEFIEALTLPQGWQAITPAVSFVLHPGEAQARIVAVSVGRGAAAGEFAVVYSVRSQRDLAIQDSDSVSVLVLPVSKVVLLLEEKPDTVIAGAECQAKLRIINQGNSPAKLQLIVASEKNYPCRLEPLECSLNTGESQPVTVTVQTDKKERSRHLLIVTVKAKPVGAKNKEMSAEITIPIDILPRVTGEPDLEHRVPTQLVLRTTAGGEGSGWQLQLSGAGTLDELKTKNVDFYFAGPDTQDTGTFGLRSEYRLNYSTDALDVRLGDQSYSLSPLTANYRYGRGVGVDFRNPDQMGLGFYHLSSRWESPQTNETGAYVSRQFGDALGLRLNFLSRNQSESGDSSGLDDRLWSLEGKWKPTGTMNLSFEGSGSHSARGDGADDTGYRIEGDGKFGRGGYYAFSKIHAGPDYAGYYSDSDYANASVIAPLGKRMQMHVSHQTSEQNLDLREDAITAPKEALSQFGFNYALPSNWSLSLDYQNLRHRDLLLPGEDDYEEDALLVSLGRSFDKYNYRLELRGARHHDLLTDATGTLLQGRLFVSYRPTRRQYFTVYGGFGNSSGAESTLVAGQNDFGVSGTWKVADDLDINLYYVKYDGTGSSDQLDFKASYLLSNGRSIGLEVRQSDNGFDGREHVGMLSYTIPFGLPVSRKRSIGIIKGRVYDGQDSSRPGVPNVVLIANGVAAVTNAAGEFFFPALKPGTYSVQVDARSIGLNRVTDCKSPIVVEVKGGARTQMDVGVIPAATVSGTLTIVAADSGISLGRDAGNNGRADPSADKEKALFVVGDPTKGNNGNDANPHSGDLGNTLVELTNGEEILRSVTDHKGAFLFERVRPGKWRLTIDDSALPEYSYLESAETEFELKSAEKKVVTVKVLPRERRIKLIQTDSVPTLKVVR